MHKSPAWRLRMCRRRELMIKFSGKLGLQQRASELSRPFFDLLAQHAKAVECVAGMPRPLK